MTVWSVAVRVYHIAWCVGVLYGVLICTSLWSQGLALAALVLIVYLNHIHDGCYLSEYERADGFPALSEAMKWLCLQDEQRVPLCVFERAVPMLLIFLLLVRATALRVLPADWL